MDDDETRVALYQGAMLKLKPYIQSVDEGKYRVFLLAIESGDRLEIDPVVFSDIKRSLDQTNNLIRRGEINGEEALKNTFEAA